MVQSSERLNEKAFGNGEGRISPLYNDVFLKVFGESEASAKGLSNAILRWFGMSEIGEVERIETDMTLPSSIGLKAPRCDVAIVAGDQVIDLEPQIKKVNIDNKALFYASKLLCANTPKGLDSSYNALPQVVIIMLLKGQRRFNGGEFVTRSRMTWERADGPIGGSDCITVIAVELDKVAEEYNGVTEEVLADELTAWLYVLARGYRNQEEVEEIMESFPDIEEFANRYGLAIDDPDIKRSYEAYQESIMEYNSIIEYGQEEAREKAREEGFKKGLEEGLETGFVDAIDEMVAQLRMLDMPEDVIEEAAKRSRSAASSKA